MTNSPSPAPRPVVLVAEDEESVREMLAIALRATRFEAVVCIDGLAASEEIQSGRHMDAALVDSRMPRLDGLGFVRWLRTHPRSQRIPVVLMSGYNDQWWKRPHFKPVQMPSSEAIPCRRIVRDSSQQLTSGDSGQRSWDGNDAFNARSSAGRCG